MNFRKILNIFMGLALVLAGVWACSPSSHLSTFDHASLNPAAPSSNPPQTLSSPGSVECGIPTILAKISLEGNGAMDHPPTVILEALNPSTKTYGPILDPHITYEIDLRNPNAAPPAFNPNLAAAFPSKTPPLPGTGVKSAPAPSGGGTSQYYLQVEFHSDVPVAPAIVDPATGKLMRTQTCEELYPGLPQKKLALEVSYQVGETTHQRREENISFHFEQSFQMVFDSFVLTPSP